MLKGVLDAIEDAVVVTDMEGRCVIANGSAERLLGVLHGVPSAGRWAETVGLFDVNGCLFLSPERFPLTRALRGEEPVTAEVLIRNANTPMGVRAFVRARLLNDEQGRAVGAVVTFHDTSLLVVLEDALALAVRRGSGLGPETK
jgi:PAS domain-containing protein